MRIGITCYPTAGGSGVIATELGLEMARRGHEVHFVAYAPPLRLREFEGNVTYHEVQASSYPLFKFPPYDIALASQMAEVMDYAALDIMHVHYAIPHAVCAVLARNMIPNCRTKVITTLHGTDITLVGSERAYFRITQWSIEQSDGVTAVSNYLRDETLALFGCANEVDVLYNFVDTDMFRHKSCPGVRARYATPEEKVVMHVSNMRPVKRVQDVIQVFARIARAVPAKLLMIGEGPDRSMAESLSRTLGIGDRVRFLGSQEDIPDLLCAADLFLLTSSFETFGLAALEAMACETPVVTSDCGGIREVVRDGVDGYIRPVGDCDGMAARALEILQDPKRWRTLADNARRRAVESFSLKTLGDAYEAYYLQRIRA